jgi:hypothetical protein
MEETLREGEKSEAIAPSLLAALVPLRVGFVDDWKGAVEIPRD